MHKNVKHFALTHAEVYHQIWLESQNGAYVSYLRGKRCKSEDDYLIEVAASFQFPYYYGENWAAFDECIQDLEWLNFTRLFIVFDDFSISFRGQPEIQHVLQDRVVEYWSGAIEYWESEGRTVEIWLNN